jgi:uncharacterized protein (DUF362 family)
MTKDCIGDAAPRHSLLGSDLSGPTVWRTDNLFSSDAFYTRVRHVWQTYFSRMLHEDSQLLIKINLNTADPYPASTSPEMLDNLLTFLRQQGLQNISVGDCSSVSSIPTRKIARKTGILDTVRSHNARMICFDEHKWRRVVIPGYFLQEVTLPEILWQTDRLIYLANIKTHCSAGVSLGLKLAVGFLHPIERYSLHSNGFLEESIAELALAVTPDLTIIDGREAFVTGGPASGRIDKIGTILMSSCMLAADLAAYESLIESQRRLGCQHQLPPEPFDLTQFRHVRDLGLCTWKKIETVILS